MTISRILVIRGGAIGDFILTLPALGLLREGFPDSHIEIMAYRRVLPLVDRRHYADSVRSIDSAPLATCFNPKSTMPRDLAEYFRSFGQIISYIYDPDLLFETSLRQIGVEHFLAASPRVEETRHAAHHLAAPLESLALFLEDPTARLHFRPEDHPQTPDTPWMALHPGSGSSKKNWPAENWITLIDRLRGRGHRVTIVGGEADADILARIRPIHPDLTFLIDLPLMELAARLSHAALFVGHDSGISHLAAAAGTPCLLLFGPTSPAVWAPFGSHVNVLQHKELHLLTPDSVLEHI